MKESRTPFQLKFSSAFHQKYLLTEIIETATMLWVLSKHTGIYLAIITRIKTYPIYLLLRHFGIITLVCCNVEQKVDVNILVDAATSSLLARTSVSQLLSAEVTCVCLLNSTNGMKKQTGTQEGEGEIE